MQRLDTIHDYLRSHSEEIGARILASYPALHGADKAPSPLLSRMLRAPYPAQTLAIMGVNKRWQLARNANVVVPHANKNSEFDIYAAQIELYNHEDYESSFPDSTEQR